MSILYFFLIFAIVVGLNWWVGSWNIILNMTNFFIAALIASSFFEPLADKIESSNPSYTYMLDFISVWLIFVVVCAAMRMATDFMSKYQLRMNIWAEYAARTILSIWLGLAFCFFTFFTLHLSPLPVNQFVTSPKANLFGFAPDRKWMAFIQSRSRGALAASKDAALLAEYDLPVHPDDRDLEARVFDPNAEFAERYIRRRVSLSKSKTLRVAR